MQTTQEMTLVQDLMLLRQANVAIFALKQVDVNHGPFLFNTTFATSKVRHWLTPTEWTTKESIQAMFFKIILKNLFKTYFLYNLLGSSLAFSFLL